ncbi:MAG: helix-turn-helix domain-containing protein [Actinomycetota bacterium]|nr:helix-turn-helix domain-containing protein [Actinomycetota bacterium]
MDGAPGLFPLTPTEYHSLIRLSTLFIAIYLDSLYNLYVGKNERETDMITAVATTGEKLKRLRRGNALTQAQLAERANVSQSTIAQIENGDRPSPHPGTLGKLAKALDVSPADLLED